MDTKKDCPQNNIDSTKKLLLDACIASGMVLSADERVGESDAATLLGYAAGTLKNMRTVGIAPPHYRRGVGGSRVSYRLIDMAEWVEQSREIL